MRNNLAHPKGNIYREKHCIFGETVLLIFEESRHKNTFNIQGNKVILSMRSESTVKQRENFVREQYRALLQAEIKRLLPRWEKVTGLKCDSWGTKYMVTKWGACNTEDKKLWFNLQLAQKPIECLEYIILHELVHLIERTQMIYFAAIWTYICLIGEKLPSFK